MYPKVNFTTSEDALANYLCYLAKQISCSYYQDRRFLVLPKPINYGRAVYFPQLSYTPEFWNNFKFFEQNNYVYDFPKASKLASNLLTEAKIAANPDKAKLLETAWKTKEKQFFDFLTEFLPTYNLDRIDSIECLVTPFGTTSTFHFDPLPKNRYKFYLTLREDMEATHIAEAILSLFFHTDNPLVTLTTWEIRENIIDFLLTKTKFAAIFDHKFTPTVSNLPEISDNLVAESQNYLAALGFPVKSVLAVNSDQVLTVNGNLVHNTFTPTEKRILICLIENRNLLISYDQIGNLFWGEQESLEKFSLQSIAKTLEKTSVSEVPSEQSESKDPEEN